jgi:hypothetical protein
MVIRVLDIALALVTLAVPAAGIVILIAQGTKHPGGMGFVMAGRLFDGEQEQAHHDVSHRPEEGVGLGVRGELCGLSASSASSIATSPCATASSSCFRSRAGRAPWS